MLASMACITRLPDNARAIPASGEIQGSGRQASAVAISDSTGDRTARASSIPR